MQAPAGGLARSAWTAPAAAPATAQAAATGRGRWLGARRAAAQAAKVREGPAFGRRALEAYKLWTYRVLGRHLEREDRFLSEHLRQADLALSPGMYRGLMYGTAAVAFAAFALATAGVFFGLLHAPNAALFTAAVPLLGAAATLAAFPGTVQSRIQNRRQQLERELPFTLSELSVLASIGLSPIVLVRRMAARAHDPALTAQFRKVVARVDTEGQELVTALADTARESPSDALREVLWDMANLVHQGGDLEAFLRMQSDNVLESLRETQKAFTDQLGTYADMYITVVLLGTMFLSVGTFIIDAFQTTAGGVGAAGLLALLTYGFLPVIVLVISILLASAYGKVDA